MTSVMTRAEAGSKSASTRLLDLLAGWAAHVGADEEQQVGDISLTPEEIGELYQEAGTQCVEWAQLSADEEAQAVRAFVTRRVLPLLVRTERLPVRHSQAA